MKIAGFEIKRSTKAETEIQKRDVTTMHNPADWLLRWLGVEENSVAVNRGSALGISAFWSAVNLISNTVAGLPVKTFKVKGGKREVIIHPCSNLMSVKPNNYIRPFMFKYMMMARALTHGNAYARIIRNEYAEPIALLPILGTVEIIAEENKKFYRIDGGEPIKDDDVFHIMGMSFNGYEGLSVITHHAMTIGLNLSALKFSEKTYKKGTHLKGIVSQDGDLSLTKAKNLKESWNESYGGPSGQDVAFLDNGAKFTPISMTMQDAEIIATMKHGVNDIARIFQVPPHKLGDLSSSTNNNIEHQSIEFAQDCIMYWAMRWEEECLAKLHTTKEQQSGKVYTNFELKGMMRGDSKARIELIRGMVEIGAISPNDALALEDMSTFEGGDLKTIQMNRIPIDMMKDFVQSMIDRNKVSTTDNPNTDTNIDNNTGQ